MPIVEEKDIIFTKPIPVDEKDIIFSEPVIPERKMNREEIIRDQEQEPSVELKRIGQSFSDSEKTGMPLDMAYEGQDEIKRSGYSGSWSDDTWWQVLKKSVQSVPEHMKLGIAGIVKALDESRSGKKFDELDKKMNEVMLKYASPEFKAKMKEWTFRKTIDFTAMSKESKNRISALSPIVEQGSLKYYVAMATQSVITNLAYLLPSLYTKNPAFALGAMGVQVGGESYLEQREKGMTPETAHLAALGYGVSEVLTEFIPVGIYLKPSTTFMRRLIKAQFTEIPTEMINTVAQSVIDKVTIEPELSLHDTLNRIHETVIVTAISTPFLAGVSHIATGDIGKKLVEPIKGEAGAIFPEGEKEPWQMTRKEFKKSLDKTLERGFEKYDLQGELTEEGRFEQVLPPASGKELLKDSLIQHRKVIKQALSEGKPVPEEVLKDYPDIQKEILEPEKVAPEFEKELDAVLDEVMSGQKEIEDVEIITEKPKTKTDKGVKKRIRELTGQVKDEAYRKLIADYKVKAKVAKEAFKSGKKEAIIKAKAELKVATVLLQEKFEVAKAKQEAITREKIEGMKREGELDKLRQRIKDRFNFIKRGIREGTIITKKQIKEVQTELTDIVDTSDLEAKDKAKFIRTIKNIQTQEQLQKALPMIEERVSKLIEASTKRSIGSKITRPVSNSTDFFYRQAIEHIQELIDPVIRSERTLKRNEQLREFIEKNEDANIPVKTLKKLLKTPLNELTVDELKGIHEEVERLRKLGALKFKLRKSKREREINNAINDVVENVTEGVGLTEEEQKVLVHATTSDTYTEQARKAGRYFRAITLRMPRITRLLEGKEGSAFEWFVNKVNVAVDNILKDSDTRYEAMNKIKAGLGIDTKTLAKTREVGGIQFSVDEMIDIYIGEKNPRKKLAIWYRNNINPELMDRIINQMTPQEKSFGEEMLKDYQEHQEKLRESVIDNENRDMGIEENYSPIKIRDIDFKTPKEQILNELLHRTGLKKGYVEKGFTQTRKDYLESLTEEDRKTLSPIQLGAYSTWLQQVTLQEEYINLMGLTKDLHKIADNETFQSAVEHKLGKEYVDRFSKYVSRVANPNIYRSHEGWENISRNLRGNVVLAYLAGNVVTMGKQLPSVFLYLPEAGLNQWTISVAEFISNPLKLVRKIKSIDPQVKHRSIERELEELKNLKADTLYRKGKANVKKYGLLGIRTLDMIAITIGENAVYNRYLSEGFSDEISLRKAQQVTLDTQPQAHPKDLPEIYASNEVINWFLQFTNQLNNIYNIATVDMPMYARNEEWLKVFYGSVAMSMVALVIWSMTHKELPDDEDDVLEAFTDQALNAIPLFGKTLQQKINGPDYGGEIPLTKNIGDLGKAIKQGYEGEYEKMANSTLRGISPLVGNPYIFERRTYNAINEGDIFELIGKKGKVSKRKITKRSTNRRKQRR